MTKCSFCGNDYEIPRGLTEFDMNGRSHHFCSSKCRKNAKMGRRSERVKWTQEYRNRKVAHQTAHPNTQQVKK